MSKYIALGAAAFVVSATFFGCGGDSQTGDTTSTGTGVGTGTGSGTGSGVGGAGTGTGTGTGTGAGVGGTGGMGTGGMGQGGAMTCMFSAFDATCNTCLDGMCMAEKAACCNAMGCVDLVDCVATNCPSGDLNCVLASCSAEIQAAGGPTGPGAMAAQGVATCGASNCPTCLGGQGGGGQGGMGQGGSSQGGMGQGGSSQGGMGQGGSSQGGMGQGGMGQGGGGSCTFAGYSNACNMCLDNQCTAEEAACCNTTGCQDLVECVAANCSNPQDLACIFNMCSTELSAAGGPSGAGSMAAQSMATCAGNNCPSCN